MKQCDTTNKLTSAEAELEKTPAAVGVVLYDVLTECPHCGKKLALNQYPYDDDATEYSLAEDDLGLALFGTNTEPATWEQLSIEYVCCGCQKSFCLTALEI